MWDNDVTLSNGALIHHRVTGTVGDPDLTLTLTKPRLFALIQGGDTDGATSTGDPAALRRLLAVPDAPDPNFPIVTP